MGLFSSKERNNLTKLLSTASSQDKVMTLDELYGFLFGLAIIPEMLIPSQWISTVFGGEEMCDLEDEKEGERLLGSLFSAYNRVNTECSAGKFAFPFDIKKATDDDVSRIRKWSHGLFLALSKSTRLFQAYKKSGDGVGGANVDRDSFAVSYCILRAVAFPEKIPEFLEQIQKGVKTEVNRVISDSNFLSMLPEAVESIQLYAKEVRREVQIAEARPKTLTQLAPLRVEKVGRNDPCPCGSGAKYKKCCGK
jgi:uncharacterized protein